MDESLQELTDVLKQHAPSAMIASHFFEVLSELGYTDDNILEIAEDIKSLVY